MMGELAVVGEVVLIVGTRRQSEPSLAVGGCKVCETHTHINKSEEVCDTWYTQVKALDLRYF